MTSILPDRRHVASAARNYRRAIIDSIVIVVVLAVFYVIIVAFGDSFLLHPRSFVLGITLEWIRLPSDLSGYITGKSSLGRRGLIIETAAGIQPGFSGCLALELSNVGEVPVSLTPGMAICQIFLHEVGPNSRIAETQFAGRRKPVLGSLKPDPIVEKLRGGPG